MATRKFLDGTGVGYLWGKIRSALNGKADSAHTHTISQVTSLQSELDSKIEPSSTEGTSQKLPSINVGVMKAIKAKTGANASQSIVLPSGGQYLVLSVSRTTVYGGVYSGGTSAGGPYGEAATDYRGFYIRLS